MKSLIFWIANLLITLPLHIILFVVKGMLRVLKNIYFNQLDMNYIDNLDGYEFEVLTKKILEKNGFKNVVVSKSSNDYGIDVFAKRKKNTYAFQCKRYQKPVGIKAVQEAKSGCEYYNCDIPVVLTNNYFTPAALNLAKTTAVELWDRDILITLLKRSNLINKSLPFYYPLIALIITCLLTGAYFCYSSYFLYPLLLTIFLLISMLVKIFKGKRKASLKQEAFQIHDYFDTL